MFVPQGVVKPIIDPNNDENEEQGLEDKHLSACGPLPPCHLNIEVLGEECDGGDEVQARQD